MYQYKPELVIIFHSTHKLLGKYNKLKPEGYSNLATTQLELVENVCFSLNANLNTKIIYYNYSEIADSVFGNYANRVESSLLFQLRKFNYELMLFAIIPLDKAYMRSYSYHDTKQLNELVKNDYWQGIEDINNEQKKNIRA